MWRTTNQDSLTYRHHCGERAGAGQANARLVPLGVQQRLHHAGLVGPNRPLGLGLRKRGNGRGAILRRLVHLWAAHQIHGVSRRRGGDGPQVFDEER